MTCDDIEKEIKRVVDEMKAELKTRNSDNLTDEMVADLSCNSSFNSLKELARTQCNKHYSIEWTTATGYELKIS